MDKRTGGVVCAARNCHTKQYLSKASLFRFPKDVTRATSWAIACGREDLLQSAAGLYNSYRLCGAHFENKMFLNDLRNRLHANAIPTIFPSLEGSSTMTDHNYSLFAFKNPLMPILQARNKKGNQLTSTIADSLNVNANLYKQNTGEEFREDPPAGIMSFHQEMTIMKTEVKEEVYDFEMPVEDMEFVSVKEEYTSSVEKNFEKQDLEVVNSKEQSLNDNLISGNCQLREEDLQKKQKLSKKPSGESKKYKCTDCKYTTHHKQSLERHIRRHTNNKPFKCTYKNCECTPGQEESCKCDTCGYTATLKQHLKGHILTKHSIKPKQYKCAHCKYATHQKQILVQHVRRHTNDRPFKCMYKNCECAAEQGGCCKCDMCGYAAKEKHNLKRHIFKKHNAESKKYKCTYCKFVTHQKHDLERHICTHTNDKPFKCTYKNCECPAGQGESCQCNPCRYSAAEERYLKVHILMNHSAEPKRYKCTDCKYATQNKQNLERHIRTHTNDRPFKCTYKNCECIAGQDESCKCNLCEYAATEEHNLKKHILRKHSGESKKYKCVNCKYAAHQKQDLDRHMHTHTNDRSFIHI